ncbi:DNA polymerase [Levilactobacillus brevis]|uniref:DNA polymerase n=1 Tax=Levilactobacillus brevis TaxID=1580 RepID=UPI000A20AF0C|nr:DNA polymerase [Levilactobacillus brevis]ARN96938.1 hypothetical protein AZI10_01685 [Levilactobacillus brevis]
MRIINQQVTYDDGTPISRNAVCNILLWPSTTELTVDSIDKVNQYIQRFPLFESLFDLEKKTYPIIEQAQDEGVGLLNTAWEGSVVFSLKQRIDELEREITCHHTFYNANDEVFREYDKAKRYLKVYYDNIQAHREFYPRADNYANVRDCVKLTGQWSHYATRTGRYNVRELPMMGLPHNVKPFLAPRSKANAYYSFDLKNIELRVASCFCQCTALEELFSQGEDVHLINGRLFASELGISGLSEAELHRLGKKLVYAILYGGSGSAIDEGVYDVVGRHVDFSVASQVRDAFLKHYPEFVRLLNHHNAKMLDTAFGEVPINVELSQTQRTNLPIQFMASFLFKHVLVACYEHVPEGRIALPVHDEIIMEIPEKDADRVGTQVCSIIQHTLESVWKDFKTSEIVDFEKVGN